VFVATPSAKQILPLRRPCFIAVLLRIQIQGRLDFRTTQKPLHCLGGKLVAPATWNQTITPAKTLDGKPTIYGYGWFVGGPISTYRGLREVGHGGDVQGFASVLYAIPEKKFAVVVLSNGENENASIEYIALARKIYDIVIAH
jgi:CubicO group peptidase (beta-lactamase class C family)